MAKSNKTPVDTTEKPGRKETACPITKEEFLAAAQALLGEIGNQPVCADVKEFSTGSFGWYGSNKITVPIGDVPLKCQVQITITAIGSKKAK